MAPAAADGELRGDEWHMCVWVHGCVHLSACRHVRVCVSVFMHLCLCVSKGVYIYAVHCHAHFPLLHVWTYIFVCLFRCVCRCVIGSVYIYTYTYSAVLLSQPFPDVHFIICVQDWE